MVSPTIFVSSIIHRACEHGGEEQGRVGGYEGEGETERGRGTGIPDGNGSRRRNIAPRSNLREGASGPANQKATMDVMCDCDPSQDERSNVKTKTKRLMQVEQELSRQGRDGQNNDNVARCVDYRWSSRALTRLFQVVSCSNRYVNVLECWVALDYMWPFAG